MINGVTELKYNKIGDYLAFIKKNNEYIILSVIFVIFIVLSAHQIGVPWDESHKGYIGAQRSLYAAAFMDFPISEHKFSQMWNVDWVDRTDQQNYKFYFHHPPGITYMVWLFFSIFGISEIVARIAPILINLLTLSFFYLALRLIFRKNFALIATSLMIISPLFFYIRNFITPELLVVLFSSVMIFQYSLWVKRKEKRYLIYIFVTFLIASLSDWQIYFLVPPIIIHYLIFERKKQNEDKLVLLLFIAPIISLAIYFTHVYFVTRSFSGEDTTLGGSLFKTLLFRMNIGENPYSITLLKLFSNLWRDLSRYFSIPLVISCVLSAILLFKEKDRLKKSILTFLWLTLIFMTSSLFILGNLYYIHNYIIMIIIIPFFALSTYGIYELIKRIKNKKAMIVSVIIFIAIIGLFYISPSIKYSAKLSEDELRTFPLVPFLKSNDGNFISYYPGHPEAFQTRYYHRGRTIIAASSDENLLAILEENSHTKKYDYLVTKREKIGVKGDTHDHLYSNYPNLELAYDWIIFKLNP